MSKKRSISKPTIERLVQLARLLEQIQDSQGIETASSADLQRLTGWTRDTIRRDISLLGVTCATVSGYEIDCLKNAIREKLHLERTEKRLCIVGLGRLGSALIDFEGFFGSRFVPVAGFDSNVNRTETLYAPFPLYSTAKMAEVIAALKIEYALLTVPSSVAQATAQKLAECGIKGIVNFSHAVLSLPKGVLVENVSVLDALQKISVKSVLEDL